jgi:alkylated DNA repair dioxygenase AlkB
VNLFENLETSNQNLLPKDGELFYYTAFFDAETSNRLFDALLAKINWRQDKIRMFGKWINQPRLTAFYGDTEKSYTYSHLKMEPEAWIEELLEIKGKVEEILNLEFSSVLMNLYRDGNDSMGWHSDDEPELGINPDIASVSFGASRQFKLRHRQDTSLHKNLSLASGSLLIMKGNTQHYWQHSIPKEKKVIAPRINLTFRKII